MTHEGRMQRGEENYNKGLLDNSDTKYFLDNSKKKPKKEKKVKESEE